MHWQLQEAKNKFSEVVKKAQNSGPQIVTLRGVETAVILSIDEYKRLTGPENNLADFLRSSPLKGSGVNIQRDKDKARDIDL